MYKNLPWIQRYNCTQFCSYSLIWDTAFWIRKYNFALSLTRTKLVSNVVKFRFRNTAYRTSFMPENVVQNLPQARECRTEPPPGQRMSYRTSPRPENVVQNLPQARECRAAPSEHLNIATRHREALNEHKMSRYCSTFSGPEAPFLWGHCSVEHSKHA